jgi:glycosyltransferase 2 family protein
VTLAFVNLPQYFVDGGLVLGLVVLSGAALLAAAMFFKDQAKRFFDSHRWLHKLSIVVEDLNIIGHSRYLYFSAFASLPYLLMQVIPIFALIKAYNQFDLSLMQAAAIMVILRMGSVVPQAPGNLGAFQALTIVGLQLFGVELGLAKRFSIVMWSVITLPLLIAGFVALAITGMRMGEIRRHAQASMEPAPDKIV